MPQVVGAGERRAVPGACQRDLACPVPGPVADWQVKPAPTTAPAAGSATEIDLGHGSADPQLAPAGHGLLPAARSLIPDQRRQQDLHRAESGSLAGQQPGVTLDGKDD